LPVERVVRTTEGDAQFRFVDGAGTSRLARMTTFVPGRLVRHVPPSAELRHEVGATLAHLTTALADFIHPYADRRVIWDLRHADAAARLRPTDADDLVRSTLEHFESAVRPALAALEVTPVHNDFTDDNVLVGADDHTISGIIDFGDMTTTHRVSDLAITLTTHLGKGAKAFEPATDVVVAYHHVSPLADGELALLYDLVRTRIAMRIAISEWRASRFPANREYILRRTAAAWLLLRTLRPEAYSRITDQLRSAVAA
jgi:Ser/Thr protein kinase RdoA (MazF antagonist)